MSKFKSEFLQIMKERGFYYQCTDDAGLDKLFIDGPVTAYIGFDCTARSLHVGSLMQIMCLRWLQKTGNNPIVLIGGATTKIGDPSGKDESRPVLTEEFIEENKKGIRSVFDKFGLKKAKMVDNNDWISELSFLDLMKIGRNFSVNRMMTQDSVKLRLEREQNLSLTEFLYMVAQSYDFAELNKNHNCKLQIGGSDQWGNIIMGVELSRRLTGKADTFGLTTPLITTSSGAKMGKTAAGAIWLSEDMLSPYDYWQFWRNTEDADVGRFLRFFTELPIIEIERLEKLQGAEINDAKIVLANEATKLCHGEGSAEKAAETAKKTFSGGVGDDLPKIKGPIGMAYKDIFVNLKLVQSGKEFKRQVEGGGAKKNGEKIENFQAISEKSDLNESGVILVSLGKKHGIFEAE